MYPLSPSRQRASDLDQIAGHAQGIMLRRVPRYARSIGANESRQLYRCRPQKDKGLPNAQNCEPGAAGWRRSRRVHLGACSTACSKRKPCISKASLERAPARSTPSCSPMGWRRAAARGRGTASLPENSRAGHFLPIDPQCPWATRSAVICRGCGTRKRPGINPGPSSFRLRVA